MKSLSPHASPLLGHLIRRNDLFDDVLTLYESDDVLTEYPLGVRFVGERAVDQGGVLCDMISAFWEVAYKHLFDGGNLLSPNVETYVNVHALQTIGHVLSHGYLVTGILPVRIAFPCLVYMLKGLNISVPNDILLSTLVDSISSYESVIFKQALSCESTRYDTETLEKLLRILSKFNSTKIPQPHCLKKILVDIATYQFQNKPFAAMCAVCQGIPDIHKLFWNQYSVGELHKFYISLTVTPRKVLQITSSVPLNKNEKRVLEYLETFIGNISINLIRRFLRFVTGSSVCSVKEIVVIYNNLDGFSRRPISHTCDNILELSVSYVSYVEFCDEFQHILVDHDYCWDMDAV